MASRSSWRRLVPLVVALLAACGKSAEAKMFDDVEKLCNGEAVAGKTLSEAAIDFRGGATTGLLCSATVANNIGGTCGEASDQNPVCQQYWLWYPSDPALCDPNGCCLICEVRVTGAAFDAQSGAAPVCASKFYRHQPC